MGDENGDAQCIVDGKRYPVEAGMYLHELRRPLYNQIKNEHRTATPQSFICNHHLLDYRINRIDQMIHSDDLHNQRINRRLTKALQDDNYEVTDVNKVLSDQQTFGERVADGVARFGGSWTFILIFVAILATWMVLNVTHLFGVKFDPYPFILLNLFLSCIAAIQAPIIMMSQNRSADRDRMDAENDFHVNLKSEHELRILHAKLDHLNQSQMPHTLEISRLQLEMMGEIRGEIEKLRMEHIKLNQSKEDSEHAR
ncbi:DUF1003 domain-containing protein [Nicoliella spurrieriana]|uniref:DUF1003 domain-containing protein n=1 Tax=Nicoliella spurrieriana TaxID=2925830 RepID=A0A976X514_9LACO|nr:DUF1003 domain-containing protein [Nicoliella spurrieriana]UQS86324.1 DUF1003 domain-containing protein [Nicoliella spurrieriana]